MKVVILAGGFGSRISEYSHLVPKPMIEIGGKPILCHIMNIYSHFGYNDFIVCAGYKQEVIKRFFSEYYLRTSDVTFDFRNNNNVIFHRNRAEPWKVTIVDTGLNTMTGGRIRRIEPFLGGDEEFMLTYGDAVSDVDIDKLLEFHKASNSRITLTAVQPGGRFGALDINFDGTVKQFAEKNKASGGWINAGFMVANTDIISLIDGDDCVFEQTPLELLSARGDLKAYKHSGFWQCMDTLKERNYLDQLCNLNQAPWIR